MLWVVVILVVWLVILTILVVASRSHYNRLTAIGEKSLDKILEVVLERQKVNSLKLEELNKLAKYIQQENKNFVQKISLLRFNPFSDTGGNQSFVLTLLDKQNNGVVITSLHSRVTTRWYAKRVKEGKGQDNELSKEEIQAIRIAK